MWARRGRVACQSPGLPAVPAWKLPRACKAESGCDSVKIIQLDISRESVGNSYPIDVPLVGDARATVELINARIKERGIKGAAENAKDIANAMAALDASIAAAESPRTGSQMVAMQPGLPLRTVSAPWWLRAVP